MKDITIVTFISNNEKINEDFFTFYNLCKNNFNVEAIVFSDKSINILNMLFIPGALNSFNQAFIL